jgi:hypothetical protein
MLDGGTLAEEPRAATRTRGTDINWPVKVFIVAGQSNAAGYNHIREYKQGQAAFPKALRNQPDILFWLAGGPDQKQTDAWSTLRVAESGSFGPEISFANDLAAATPDEQIAIIKCAMGGTGIARSVDYSDYIPAIKGFNDRGKSWHPPAEGREAGILYQRLINNVRDALAVLDRRHTEWELAACLWMQGEHEAGISRRMAEDYDKLLVEFTSAVRRDLKVPSLPFVIGEVNSHKWAYGDVVRIKQAKVCQEDRNAVLVKTTDLSRKGSGGASHFDADGMLELGSRFAKVLTLLAAEDKTEQSPGGDSLKAAPQE